LADELPYLTVDGHVCTEGGVAHAGGLGVGGAAEDNARVGVDQLIAGGPPGAVVDGAGGFVAGVELVQEARARDHLVAGGDEKAAVGPGGAVIRAAEGDPVVDVGLTAEVLEVVTAGEAAHRVGDDVDLSGAGGGADLVDAGLDVLSDRGVRLRAAKGVGEEAVGLPAIGLKAGERDGVNVSTHGMLLSDVRV